MTATVYSGIRYFRRKSRRFTRLHWTGLTVWWCVLGIAGFFALNLIYQVMRKPGEIFAPISASLSKSPVVTWESYGALFEKHSTSIISPELLAALAQVESDGNPVARTYWRWQWSWSPFEIYRPASSAPRHVSNHRRNVCRGQEVLHPESYGCDRRSVVRSEFLLVQ